jgi:uncharacterized protein YecT (DUF1311 family)
MRFVTPTLLLMLLTNIAVAAGICASASSTQEVEKCLKQEITKADARLNASYKAVLGELDRMKKDNPGAEDAKKKLVLAQRAWIQYRDNDCDAVHALHIEGSLRGVLYLQCVIDHTDGRTDELDALIAY